MPTYYFSFESFGTSKVKAGISALLSYLKFPSGDEFMLQVTLFQLTATVKVPVFREFFAFSVPYYFSLGAIFSVSVFIKRYIKKIKRDAMRALQIVLRTLSAFLATN